MTTQPTTDEQLQALRAEFEEYWATCLHELVKIWWLDIPRLKDRCWRSWLHAKGVSE